MSYPLRIANFDHAISMYVHDQGDQFVSKKIRENGIWEAYETALIIQALEQAENFVDVGANIGYYSLIAAKLLEGRGQVYAFEPEPKNFAVLQRNQALNQLHNLQAFNLGLSDQAASCSLYLSDDNFGDHQIYDRGETREKVEVELVNGSNFLATHISHIDVLKVDTQGAEFLVLSGLQRIISNSPNITMIIEFWPLGLRKSGFHAHQLLDLLLAFGRPMYIVDQIEGRLIPCQESDLRPWIDDLDVDSLNEGFLNLYFGEPV